MKTRVALLSFFLASPGLFASAVSSADGAPDKDVFPNQVQTTPGTQGGGARAVGVPQPERQVDPGSLSPQNMSQMGMGVQIPLESPPKKPPKPDADSGDTPASPGS